MEDTKVIRSIDAKGLSCPMPVIKAKRGISEIEMGEVIEVLSTDPGSMADFKAWARSTGHELLLSQENAGVFTYHIRRAK